MSIYLERTSSPVNNPYSPFFSAFVAFFITVILIPGLVRLANKYKLFDVPGGRKTHLRPVPRLGGAAMLIGIIVPVTLWMEVSPLLRSVVLGLAAVSLVGLLDDLIAVTWWKKLLVHLSAASLVVMVGQVRIENLGFWSGDFLILPAWLSIAVSIVFIVGVTNAINLADGLDGLAAGLCVLIFGTILAVAYLQGLTVYFVPLCAIMGAVTGFLRYNTYPATIFMGDSGSYLLGFSAAVFSILVTQVPQSSVAPSIILLILGLPLIDTMEVMLERLITGNPVFLPDRRHLHYRLVKLGFTHKEAVIILYALQALLIYMVIELMFRPDWVVLSVFVAIAVTIVSVFFVAAKLGWRFERTWALETWFKRRLKERYQKWLVEIPRMSIEAILVTYMVAAPMYPYLKVGSYCAILLIVPILLAANRFMFTGSLNMVYRIVAFFYLSILTYNFVQVLPGSSSLTAMIFYGALFVLVILLGAYIKFSSATTFQITPLDVLVVLVAIAIPLFPMEREQARVVSIFFFTLVAMFFSVESVMARQSTNDLILSASLVIGSSTLAMRALFF